jgi:predicted methyltransferase
MKTLMSALVVAALLWAPAAAATPTPSIEQVLASPQRSEADRERDTRSHPEVILALLALQAGDKVADIFAGGGYYSELIGRLVGPEGKVLLHNNKAYINFVGKALDERLEATAVPAMVRHDREIANLDLGRSELDAVLIVMSYHDLYHTAEGWPAIDVDNFMGQIVAALKPGGRFLLVDHAAPAGSGKSMAQDLHRIEEAFVKSDVQRFGFKLVGSADVLRNPEDDYTLTPFAPEVRGKTDRFVLVFEKR